MKKDTVINILKAILSTISLIIISDMPIVNITIPLAIFVLYFFYKNINIVKKPIVFVCSAALSFFVAFGKTLVFSSEVGYGVEFWIKTILLFVGFFIFFISFISKIDETINKKKLNNDIKYSPKLIFVICFLIILISWIPYMMAEYPSPFLPDTASQFLEITGNVGYNNANPFIHTIYIKVLFDIVSIFTNSMNDTLFGMSIIQCIINAAIYSYVIIFFYKRTGKIIFVILSTLFFALVYYNPIYNLTISKDTSFSIVCFLLVVIYIKYTENKSILNRTLLVVFLIVFGLSRINAYYALIFGLLLESILMIFKKTRKQLSILLLISVVLCILIKGPVYSILFDSINGNKFDNQTTQAESKKENIEIENNEVYKGNSFLGNIISKIPTIIQTQQIANVVYHERELNEKEMWLIEEACPIDVIKETYDPILWDSVGKAISSNAKETYSKIDRLEYFKLWLELYIKYPSDYVEAYLNMTRYYFYPNRAVKTAYTEVWNNGYDISKVPLISNEYTENIENIENIQVKTPIVANLFSPGTTVFILLIVLTCLILNKSYEYILPCILYFGVFLTLILSVPINDEFRYIYPLVNALPIFCIIPFLNGKKDLKE